MSTEAYSCGLVAAKQNDVAALTTTAEPKLYAGILGCVSGARSYTCQELHLARVTMEALLEELGPGTPRSFAGRESSYDVEHTFTVFQFGLDCSGSHGVKASSGPLKSRQ